MDIGSILLILGLLILVGLYVSRPLLERRSVAVSEDEQVTSALMAERDRILDALQELDFDHALGKIPADEYPAQRAGLLQRGANILRQLDQEQALLAEQDIDSRLEAAIAARRADAGRLQNASLGANRRPKIAPPDDELESLIAARRRMRSEKAAGFCPGCGQPVSKSDQFCAKCGVRLH